MLDNLLREVKDDDMREQVRRPLDRMRKDFARLQTSRG